MNPASTVEFRENRAKFNLAELQKHEGQWVAFNAQGNRILASGTSLTDVFTQLREAKVDLHAVAFEHIQIYSDEISIGGAEFL